MDSGIVGASKNFVDFIKEIYFFAFRNEYKTNINGFTINLIAALSKNSETQKEAYFLLKALLNNGKQEKSNLLKLVCENNTDIASSNINNEINIFFNYFSKIKIDIKNLTIERIESFNQFLINKIHRFQNKFRKSLIYLFLLSIITSIYFNNDTFMLLNFLNIFPYYHFKHNKYSRFYNVVKSFTMKEVLLEDSILYKLTEVHDTKWFSDIKKKRKTEILLNQNSELIMQDTIEKEVFNINLLKQTINQNSLNETNIKILLEDEGYGIFKITNEINNINDQKILIPKILNYIIENKDFDKKSFLLHNIKKMLEKAPVSNIIKKWFISNKQNIHNIIENTNNKINLFHLFSHLNKKKLYLNNNKTVENIGVIKCLNEIENTILENMSSDNFIDVFYYLKHNKEKYNFINHE